MNYLGMEDHWFNADDLFVVLVVDNLGDCPAYYRFFDCEIAFIINVIGLRIQQIPSEIRACQSSAKFVGFFVYERYSVVTESHWFE